MPRKETRHAGILGDMKNLLVTLEAHKEQLPQLEPFRARLGGILTDSLDASQEQAALTARKQESSKRLRRLLTEGQAVAHVIRTVVKNHFGPREEKIVEFGLQPVRGRKVKATTPSPTPATPPAPVDSAAPVTSDP